ncbi:MAG TPA: cobalt-precorrin-5B (C(1))-methyltransferase CbiD [Armatimonadota bacterium]|nr:cobalt-precorrin-5B (C(1))-methyltransferase CbiD [Armatimonadota bacterium]
MTTTLRSGYTTGTCAAAAAKAAALCLRGETCWAVEIVLPDGAAVTLPVEEVERLSARAARAAVVKDAGDDPDITHGMRVVATIDLTDTAMTFHAGEGVGTVTLPGLQISPGEPAINPVPRAMIVQAIREVLGEVGCRVTVSIPGGAAVAAKTFNPRLGITGGLSILGTSGRVLPKSEEAWLQSLLPQVDVALAAGLTTLYLTPGGFGERAAREGLSAPAQAVIQTSNFIGDVMRAAAERGARALVLVGHVGKLVKIAAGLFNTHSRFGDARLETVAALAAAEGAPAPLVAALLELPTCEAAIPVLESAGLAGVWDALAERAARRATQHAGAPVDCALTGYAGEIIGRSAGLREEGAMPEYWVVGVGPGPAEWLTPAAWQRLRRAQVAVGGARQLAAFAPPHAEQIVIGAEMAPVIAAIRARRDKAIVVLASGDPGCFGILATLRRELGDLPWQVLPGISAMQLALARLGESWQDVRFCSAHGREADAVLAAAGASPRVLALTDRAHPAQALAQQVHDAGLRRTLVVLERLGYPDERITRGTAEEIARGEFDPLAVVWIEEQ